MLFQERKKFCNTGLVEHKVACKRIQNQTRKVIAKSMKVEAEKEMEDMREKPNKIFKFVKLMKKDGKWMKDKNRRLGFSE